MVFRRHSPDIGPALLFLLGIKDFCAGLARVMWILAFDPARVPVVLRTCGVKDPTTSLIALFRQIDSFRTERRLYVLAILAHFIITAPLVGLVISFAFSHSVGSGVYWAWDDRLTSCLHLGIKAGSGGGLIVGVLVFVARRGVNFRDAVAALFCGTCVGLASGLVTAFCVAAGLGDYSRIAGHLALPRLLLGGGIFGFGIGAVFGMALGSLASISEVFGKISRRPGPTASGPREPQPPVWLTLYLPVRFRHTFVLTIPLAALVGWRLAGGHNEPGVQAFSMLAVFCGTLLSITRVFPIYPACFFWQIASYFWQLMFQRSDLYFSPAWRSSFSYLPYPFLSAQIVHAAGLGPVPRAQSLRVIRRCLQSRGLKGQASRALALLQSAEIEASATVLDFHSIACRSSFWLRVRSAVSPTGFGPVLRRFQLAAACIDRAEKQEHPECLSTLSRADRALSRLDFLTLRRGAPESFRGAAGLFHMHLVRRKEQRSQALTPGVIEARTALKNTRNNRWIPQRDRIERIILAAVASSAAFLILAVLLLSIRQISDPAQRTSALTPLGTFAAIIVSGILSYRSLQLTSNTAVVARDKQYTDRFNEAMKYIDHSEQGVRHGAVIALDRLCFDSDRDYGLVVEMLAGHVRRNSRRKGQFGLGLVPVSLREDVEAALIALCRRREGPATERAARIDLSECYFGRVTLPGARLAGATLRRVNLVGADLSYADLRGADLAGAELQNSLLIGADLRGANLTGADLTGADLRYSDRRDANVSDARGISTSPRRKQLTLSLSQAELIFDNVGAASTLADSFPRRSVGRAESWVVQSQPGQDRLSG